MNISPISINYYKKASVKFCGKDNSVDSKPDFHNPSKQNNSPEIYISPEALKPIELIQRASNEAFEEEWLNSTCILDASECTAESFIHELKKSARLREPVPSELKGKIPVFVALNIEDYIKLCEKVIKQKMDLLGLDDEADNAIFEDMFDALEVLQTTKRDALLDALNELSERINYMYLRAVNAGFNGDAREVINLLSNNMMLYCKPCDKFKNNDGTATYFYETNNTKLMVVRNEENGDFISAKRVQGVEDVFTIKFKKDGSIEELCFSGYADDSKNILRFNSKNDELSISQFWPESRAGMIRKFERQKDGTLRTLSIKPYMK